ncbi:YagK/YfjJ domain-containing protein [Pseudomonas aeruginosa]|uniref:YagK/YfjJ domain-containing protein n=1 Tax=Pseudomonas aeruginosa TaxID=287 RepID=UPI0008775485|nr:inovirus-type Gp2 protein [Pseudomonas aeruginosa]
MNNRKTNTYLSQSGIALQIESLVQAIENTDTPAFRITQSCSGYERVEETRLSRYFTHIKQMVDLFDDRVEYSYSEHLQAFRQACQDIRLERDPDGPVCLNERGTDWLSHHQSMNVLTARIRQLTCEQWYRRRSWDRSRESRKQEREITDYVDAVLDRYSRTSVVRIDLYYRSDAQARLRVEHAFDDLKRLVAEHEDNSIFDHLTGYIHSVEQGNRFDGRGYHVHAAYFFNGNEVRGDIHKAQLIGELWERITRGNGCFNSCNHSKDRYQGRLGIGMISRDDHRARRDVHYTMRYLVKDEQSLLVKPLRAKCLRKGQAGRRHANRACRR